VIWRAQAVALVLTAPLGAIEIPRAQWTVVPVLSLLALGALGTGIAFVMMTTAAGRLGATRASGAAFLMPAVALLLGVLVRGERVAWLSVIGCAVAIAGAWIMRRAQSVQPQPAQAGLQWSESLEGVDWDELATMYREAPLGEKRPADLATAFANSRYRVFVRDGGTLVGAGRALADGVDAAYICDVAVRPTHQRRGLGKAIVSRLVELSKDHRKILLYAVPGKEPFYRNLGFLRMATAMALFRNEERMVEAGVVVREEGWRKTA
jgi:ribosomal protein S18 acetylase RimI-like enzyme